MASEFSCPHCGGTLKTIPLSRPSTNGHGHVADFTSTAPVSTSIASTVTQSTTARGFWASEGVNSAIVGLFSFVLVWLFLWWYELPTIFAVIVGLGVGIGLAVLRIMLYAPPKPQEPEPATTIRIEQISEDQKHWLLADLDERITLADLRKIPLAVTQDHHHYLISQAALTARNLTQPKARLILSELKRMGLAYTTDQNRTLLTRGGRSFIKQITALPS